jgi:hypothetical protein
MIRLNILGWSIAIKLYGRIMELILTSIFMLLTWATCCAHLLMTISRLKVMRVQIFNKLELMVCRCTAPDPSSGLPNTCASPIDTDAYFNVHLDLYDFFKVRLFFVDTVISPSNDNPISLTLERDIFVTFTDSMGSRGEVTLGRYTIQTD